MLGSFMISTVGLWTSRLGDAPLDGRRRRFLTEVNEGNEGSDGVRIWLADSAFHFLPISSQGVLNFV